MNARAGLPLRAPGFVRFRPPPRRLIRRRLGALADPEGFAASWSAPRVELVQDAQLPPPRRSEVDSLPKLFAPRAVDWFWPFAREEPHGHPPFYAIVGLIGDVITPWREDLP